MHDRPPDFPSQLPSRIIQPEYHQADSPPVRTGPIVDETDLDQTIEFTRGVHSVGHGAVGTRVSVSRGDDTSPNAAPSPRDGGGDSVPSDANSEASGTDSETARPTSATNPYGRADAPIILEPADRPIDPTRGQDAVDTSTPSTSRAWIRPKSREVIQAQIAAFAQRGLTHTSSWRNDIRESLVTHAGILAEGPAEDVAFGPDEQPQDTEREAVLPTEEEQSVVQASDYIRYLREAKGSRNPAVEERARYLHAYKDFAPQVNAILSQYEEATAGSDNIGVQNGRYNAEVPDVEIVGIGSLATAVAITHGGKDYIAKITHEADEGALDADERMQGLKNGAGIPHLEQMVAYSYETGVTITERIPGRNFAQLPLEDTALMTDKQFAQALDTMRAAQVAGVRFDDSGVLNNMYDPREGFGFVDFEAEDEAGFQSFAEKVGSFAANLVYIGSAGDGLDADERHARVVANSDYKLQLIERFRSVCESHLSPKEFAEVDEKVAEFISEYQEEVDLARWSD